MRFFNKNILSILTLTFLTVFTSSTFGHSDHGHGSPIAQEQAVNQAAYIVALMVQKEEKVDGKPLAKSWVGVKDKKLFKKSFRHYIVSFHDAKLNKTLYIMLNAYGDLEGANFTGTFDGVK